MDVLESGCRSLSRRLEAVWRPVCFLKKDDINRSANERKLKDAQTLSSKRKGIHLHY